MSNRIYSEDELLSIREREEEWLLNQPEVTGSSVRLGATGNPCLCLFTTSNITDRTKTKIQEKLSEIPINWSIGEFISY